MEIKNVLFRIPFTIYYLCSVIYPEWMTIKNGKCKQKSLLSLAIKEFNPNNGSYYYEIIK